MCLAIDEKHDETVVVVQLDDRLPIAETGWGESGGHKLLKSHGHAESMAEARLCQNGPMTQPGTPRYDATGELDGYGVPVRLPWQNDYQGDATVLYGHTPVRETGWVKNTLCLDTGCVFGGTLSALRWPERELIQVPARREWYPQSRPLV